MKNTHFYSALVLFCMLTFISNLTKANTLITAIDPVNLQQLATQHGAQYKLAKAKVVSSSSGQDVAIFTTAPGSDAIIDLYVLQGVSGPNLDLTNAELVFSQSTIIIKNLVDSKIYMFYTDNATSIHSKVSPSQITASYVGYGLVNYFNLNQYFTKTNLLELLQANTVQGGITILARKVGGQTSDPVGSTCLAGGCGSSSCSLDASVSSTGVACSVSCNSGYYACCGELTLTANQCGCRPSSECPTTK